MHEVAPPNGASQPSSLQAAIDAYLQQDGKGKTVHDILQSLTEFSATSQRRHFGDEGAELPGSEEEARRLWQQQGWLPAAVGPHEDARRRVLCRHSLGNLAQCPSIDRVTDLAKELFDVPTVIVSLVMEDRQILSEPSRRPSGSAELLTTVHSFDHWLAQGGAEPRLPSHLSPLSFRALSTSNDDHGGRRRTLPDLARRQ